MKSSAKKVELAPYDDLFSTEESRQDAKLEKVREIPLSELHPFKNHPFKVKDDEAMMETADSVRQYGVLVPAIARPDPEGGYELVAGHRRHRASELAEKETMPVIVRDLDDDAATIIMVDSNLQRESLLPSERAFAYKMKLEAMKHQGERMDLTCSQVGNKSAGKKSSELLAEQVGQSKNQIFRYIRLTELIPELLDIMQKINLRDLYPDVYKTDVFVDVAEEVVAAIRGQQQDDAAYERRMYRHKAHYSLNREDGIENDALNRPLTPEEILEQKQLREEVYAALMQLPAIQARRIYARFYLGMTVVEIARIEGADRRRVWDSIRRGLKKLARLLDTAR